MANHTIALLFYYRKETQYSINALLNAVSQLEENRRNKVYILRSAQKLLDELPKIDLSYRNKILFFSVFSSQFTMHKELWQKIRALPLAAQPLIVAGGPHPTGAPEEILHAGADIAVIGEGELTIQKIINHVHTGESLQSIPGLALRLNKQSIIIKQKSIDDSDRHLKHPSSYNSNIVEELTDAKILFTEKPALLDLNNYYSISPHFHRYGPVEITRGCPYYCRYCQTSFLFGPKIRHRSIKNILEQIRMIIGAGLRDIFFTTPSALSYGSFKGKEMNIDAVEQLLFSIRQLIGAERRIFFGTFPSELRPEHIQNESMMILKKYVNNKRLIFGCQSGSDKVLRAIHRGHTTLDVENAIELSLRYGFVPNVDFILGLPQEEEEDQWQTIHFIDKITKMGALAHLHYFMPLPQTPMRTMQAKPISTQIRQILGKWTKEKKIYGKWQAQELMSLQS